MAQTCTSANTSINRTRLPAVYGKIHLASDYVLDYGCGKYTEHIRSFLKGKGKVYLPYDPYNQPDAINALTIGTVCGIGPYEPIDVVCSNVLNVIDDDDTVRFIAEQIETIVRKTGGTGYVTVYEGNRSGQGKKTGSDQFQRNAPLRSYLRFFRNATVQNGMIIVRNVSC